MHTPAGAGVVALDAEQRVLLMWRHRYITDGWGWEIPIGKIEDGETPAEAAAREFEEETGWRAGPLRHLLTLRPTPGLSDSEHHIYQADTARRVGSPADAFESERIAWVPLSDLSSMIAKGEITSGTTLAALLYVLTGPAASGDSSPGHCQEVRIRLSSFWRCQI